MKSYTEEELLAGLAADGTDRYELQMRFAEAFGMSKAAMGTVDQADIIVGGDWPTPMRSAQRHQCEICNVHVSLAPSSQAAMAERPRHVVCIDCVMSGKADKLLRQDKADA